MSTPDRDRIDGPQRAEAEILELITQVARELGKNARVQVVFGDAVDRDRATVIPVARAKLGIGGRRSGKAAPELHVGAGLRVTPVGFIEVADGKVRFRRILPTWLSTAFALGIGALAGLVMSKAFRSPRRLV